MARIRVAVVYGGRSSEHGISVVSAGSVLRALDPEKYDVVPVGITPSGGWTLTASDPDAMQISGGVVPEVSGGTAVALPADPGARHLVPLEPGAAVEALAAVDVVFPLLHGRFGEDGTIQGLLDLAGIPYVGSGVFASAAAMDKVFAKKLLQAEGLRVGEYAVVREGQHVSLPALTHLGLPAFVKPARAGSSVGITKIRDWSELPDALELAFQHDSKVLVESAIVGREIECGVLEADDGTPEASVPAEIRVVRGGHDWYDYEAKYLEDACEFDIPAGLSPEVTAAVQRAACQAFVALECAGLARVDFFVTDDGPVINEVNTMPGFTPISLFPQVWAASGVDYPSLIDRLIAAALRRGPAR